MRIDTQNTTPPKAEAAPGRQTGPLTDQASGHAFGRALGSSGLGGASAETFAMYADLLRETGSPDSGSAEGPAGIASAASRAMSDPLGLATEQAAVTPVDSPLANQTIDQTLQPRGAVGDDALAADRFVRTTANASEAIRTQASAPESGDRAQAGQSQSASDLVRTASRNAADPNAALNTNARSGVAFAPGAAPSAATTTVGNAGPGTVGSVGAIGGSAAGGPGSGSGSGLGTGVGTGSGDAGGAGSQNLPGAVGSGRFEEVASARGESAKPAQGQTLLRSEQAEIAPQVAKGLASLVLRDGGSAHIQLRPEALGRVEVDLTVRDGAVHASLSAENDLARELLSDQLDQLRSLLEQRGLRVESLEVTDAAAARDAQAYANDDRGGRWMSAQDEPRGTGTDAGQDRGTPGDGGDPDRNRGGAPTRSAERSGTPISTRSAEPGWMHAQAMRSAATRWDPGTRTMRLDTVA